MIIQSIEWPYIHSCISLGWNNPCRNGWTNKHMLTRMLMQGGTWREMPKKFEQFLWWPMLRRFDRPLFRLFAGSTSTFREDARKDCGNSGVGERRRGDKFRWYYWGQSFAIKWWDSNSPFPRMHDICFHHILMTSWFSEAVETSGQPNRKSTVCLKEKWRKSTTK